MKFLLKISLILFFFSTVTFASQKGISIKANTISYTKDKEVLIAQGSVEITYKDTKIKADRIIYFTLESHVIANGNFSLSKDKIRIVGSNLDYYLKRDIGTAYDVFVSMGKIWITGKSIEINPDKIKLTDAVFSSCDLKVPHYKLSSAHLVYYENSGWLVQNLGLLYLLDIPVFPVLTYVYDTGLVGGMYRKKNLVPIPEISSNDIDGLYISEKLMWRLSQYSYGILSLNYGSKKGFGVGFESNYILNDSNNGVVEISTYGSEGSSYGISHTYYFGEPIETNNLKPLLYDVLEVPKRKKYDLTTNIFYRQRINYERVSLLPMVTIRYIDVPFKFFTFSPKIEFSLGSISEEATGINVLKSSVKTKFDYVFDISDRMNVKTGLDFNYSTYGNNFSSWNTLLGRVDSTHRISENVEAGIGYSHYFINSGSSPFRYENYRFYSEDDIRGYLNFNLNRTSFGINVSYNTPLLTPRDIDYNATIALHCFESTFMWRAVRQEFLVSFNFISD